MRAFFLGAGSSCGTFKGSDTEVPVSAHFGRVLSKIHAAWVSDYDAVAKVVSHLGLPENDWGLEPVWSCMDYYAKLHDILGEDPPWWNGGKGRESCQLKKALLEVYGNRCDEAADDLGSSSTMTDYTLRKLIENELSDEDALISFNYDTIIERLMKDLGKKPALFAKPHGSTSWTLGANPRVVKWTAPDQVPLYPSLELGDVDSKREPLVLGAVPIKSELIEAVQIACASHDVFKAIMTQWSAVFNAVRDAEKLVIVGYSFPREDQYGRFVFQEGLRKRKQKPAIEFFELRHKAGDLAKEIMDAFGEHIQNLVYRGEVTSPWSR